MCFACSDIFKTKVFHHTYKKGCEKRLKFRELGLDTNFGGKNLTKKSEQNNKLATKIYNEFTIFAESQGNKVDENGRSTIEYSGKILDLVQFTDLIIQELNK